MITYTNEELEAQVEGALKRLRHLSSRLEESEVRCIRLLSALRELMQSYHLLASSFSGRHQSATWEDCEEGSCQSSKKQLEVISLTEG